MTTLDVTNKAMSCLMFQSFNNLNPHNTFLLIIGVFKGYLPHHKNKNKIKKLFPTVICAVSHGGLWVTKQDFTVILSYFHQHHHHHHHHQASKILQRLAEFSNVITAKREYSD